MSEESAFEVGRLYAPIKQIADTLVSGQKDIFVRLPGLLAYYPGGIRTGTLVTEHSGNGFDLSQTGLCPTGYDGNSFVHLGDGTNFLYNTSSQFNLTGTGTYIEASLRGLTIGGWFMVDAWPASVAGFVSKFGGIGEYGYGVGARSTGVVFAVVSGNGSDIHAVDSQAIAISQWLFVALRFTPSVELAVFTDGDKATLTTAIPASINASLQDFEVGRYGAGASQIIHGKARDVFICAASLPDDLIQEIRVTSVP